MSVWLWLVTTGAMAAKTPQKTMMRPSKVLTAASERGNPLLRSHALMG